MKKVLWLSVLLVAVLGGHAVAAIRLPAVVGSNMVLQRNTYAPIWGWAEPGSVVTVKGSWQWYGDSAVADADGKWMLRLATPRAGGPYTVTIAEEGGEPVVLENVLSGEVWLASGQSNMQWAVRAANDAEAEIAAAKYPRIRLFYVPRTVSDTPQEDVDASWTETTPETVADFSAVAYYFGRYLHKELDVPVGLIHSSWGGTPAEAWTRRPILTADEQFAPIVERYQHAVENWDEIQKGYQQRVAEWKEAVEAAKEEGKPAPRRPYAPIGPGHPHSPGGLYNAMIAPLIPYAIRGAIWYQGESNAGRAYQYRRLFPAMIENWRQDWGQGEFPFYFVQIAPYQGQNPEIREAQLIAYRNTANTGMVVTMDIGNPTDIHPRNKQDVGKRLALWALAKTYGKDDIVYSGPLYKGYRVEDDRVRVFFDHVGSGLKARGGELTHFTIAPEGGEFVPAQAKIDGESVVVWSDEVEEPAAVRYGWENAAEPNLFNKEGLPASPFRTDDRPGVTFGVN